MSVSKIMTKKVVSIDGNENISKALDIMDSKGIKELPVVSKNKYIGLLLYYDLISKDVMDQKAKVLRFIRKTHVLGPKDPIERALSIIQGSGVGAIPILDEKRIIGIVSDYDLFKILINNRVFDNLKVEDVILRRFPILRPEDSIAKANDLAAANRIDRVPIVDNFNHVVGEVLVSDILKYIFKTTVKDRTGKKDKFYQEVLPQNRSVMEIAVRELPPISLTMNLRRALEIMLVMKIKGTVVTDNDNVPVGVLSRLKILDMLGGKNLGDEISIEISGDQDWEFTLFVRGEINRREKYLSKLGNITKIKVHVKKVHDVIGKYQINMLVFGNKKLNVKVDGLRKELLMREALDKLENMLGE